MSHTIISLRCPLCGSWSLTFDWVRNGYICHAYAGFIPEESLARGEWNKRG